MKRDLGHIIHDLALTLILALGFALTAALAVACAGIRASVSMDLDEVVTYASDPVRVLVLAAGLAALLALLGRPLSRISERALFCSLAALYVLGGLALIYLAGYQIRMDQHYVYSYALEFARGVYEGLLPDKYIGWYPHQLGLLTYDRLLLGIAPSTRTLFLANLVLAIGINYLQWKNVTLMLLSTARSQAGGRAASTGEGIGAADSKARMAPDAGGSLRRGTILLSFAFLPQFFYILFAYGQIPGLFFVEAAVFFLLLWLRRGRRIGLPLCALCLGLAQMVKPNYQIAAIAVALLLFLRACKERRRELFLGILAVLAVSLAEGPLVKLYYERESGMEIRKGIPMVSYFVMGLQEDPEKPHNKGWSNEYNLDVYAANGFDHERAAAAAREDLRERVGALAADPAGAGAFFLDKAISTWCDPMFQSVWSGPKASLDQDINTGFLRSFYEGEGIYPAVVVFMNALTVLLFAGIALGLLWLWIMWKKRAKNPLYPLLPVLFFLGGFLYHLLSETKSQYVYMYVYCMIPLAVLGWQRLFGAVGGRLAGNAREQDA